MKLICTRLLASDVPAAIAFWRDVMQLPVKYSDESIGYAYFDTGAGAIEIMRRDDFAEVVGETTPAPAPAGRVVVIQFQVDDVDAAYAELLARGAKALGAPQDRPAWNARVAQVGAPDGQAVELYSPLGS